MAIITISKGTLSGGQALAQLVARQLGYPCVSREEIINSTDWYGIPMDMPASPVERLPSYWDRLAGEREAYLESFQSALCERASHGNLVYHGHAGHLLIPEVPVLRVRVVADLKYRVAAVVRDLQMTEEDAEAYIRKVDAERKEWVRYLYGVEWDDPILYDVVLNLSHVSLDSACLVVVHMARLDEYKLSERSLQVLEDEALQSRFAAILARDVRTADLPLRVTAREGMVTISGTAPQDVVNYLPALIAEVEGTKEIRYEVQVSP